MNANNNTLFFGIEEQDITKLLECLDPLVKSYLTGDTICSFTDNSNFVGIVKNGMANIYRTDINGTRTVLESVSNNEIFGKIFYSNNLLTDEITVICEKDCEIMFIDYFHITKRCANACERHSVLVQNMLEIMSLRASILAERVEVLSRRTIKEKIITYFVLCSNRNASNTFEIPFSYTTLAEYLCIDRSAMMRELKNLKNQGVIKTEKRKVELVNFELGA